MDYDKASQFWIQKDQDGIKKADVKEDLCQLIESHHVCALATGSGDFVRCTPLEYIWLDGTFYIFSEGGLKFKALKDNRNVCLAIFDDVQGNMFGNLRSAQISGTAEVIEPFLPEYLHLLEVRHIPEAAIKAMPEPIHLIKITPVEADYLCSSLKQEGYSTRQHIVF